MFKLKYKTSYVFFMWIIQNCYNSHAQNVEICLNEQYVALRGMISNYTCNKQLFSCGDTWKQQFGEKLTQTVIVLHNNRSKIKLINFINNFSKCLKNQVIVFTSNDNEFSWICSSNYLPTLVIDLTDFESVRFFKKNCSKYDVEEIFQGLNSIIKVCHRLLLVNNITCDNYPYHPSIYEIFDGYKDVLRNKTIRITPSKTNEPFIIIKGQQNMPNHVQYSGMLFEMINRMADNLGFNYTVVPAVDTDYGSLVNGSWNGLIGMLARKETDIVLADLTVTYNRSVAIDFSIPYFNEPIGIIIQYSKSDRSLLSIVKLFTPNVWIIYFISICIAIVTIWALHKYTLEVGDVNAETLSASAWYVFAQQVNQKAERIIYAWSGRIFEVFWRFVAFLVISTYTGGFVADLTSSRVKVPFENLAELVSAATNGDYKICMAKNTAFTTAVMANDSGPYQNLRKWILDNPNYFTTADTCKKLLTEKTDVAYVAQMTNLDVLQKEGCENNKTLLILNDRFFSGFFSLGFQKDSPYKEIISDQISQFNDIGLMDKWYKNYSKKMPFCEIYQPDQILDASSQGLAMSQIGGAFIVLGIGIVIGCFVFFYEIPQVKILLKSWNKYRRKSTAINFKI